MRCHVNCKSFDEAEICFLAVYQCFCFWRLKLGMGCWWELCAGGSRALFRAVCTGNELN
jgi:hypothetical protein